MSKNKKSTPQDDSFIFNNSPQQFKKKYCRFKKSGIKYIDFKNSEFLMKFINDQG